LFGDSEARPIPGLVFPEEATDVNIAVLYSLDEPFRDLASRVDRCGTGAVSVLLGVFPISFSTAFWQAVAMSGASMMRRW
jgi:hypothetical protein